jgi:methylenetetrahydrofolate reductase (NADPH)
MKITKLLKHNEKRVSFEFFPPKTEKEKESLLLTIKALKKYKPIYTSMTYGAGGTAQGNTKTAVDMLLREKDLVVMPHLTCIGTKEEDIEDLLKYYKNEGIENIMALRGDLPDGGSKEELHEKRLPYACNLVGLIKKLNHFCIGVAIYPEGHIETSSLNDDLEYTKQKIDAGADFAVTQMFLDNKYYYSMLDRMKKKGITIPTLPGILPLTDINKLKRFASLTRTTIPKGIENTMNRLSKNKEDMKKAGIDYTIKQCKDLIKNGSEKIHFFTLNQPEVMKIILEAI